MAHNFQRPSLPYEGESLQNDKRYQLLTRAKDRPPTDAALDTDFNYLIDAARQLDEDIANVAAGILPGADDPENENFFPTTDGDGNISWTDVSDENVRDRSLSAVKMLPGTLTAFEMMDGTLTANKLAPNAVTTIKILDFNVTANKLAPDAATTEKIPDEAITTPKISSGAVTTEKIPDDAITTPKIVDGNVTLIKLAQDVIDAMDRLVPIGAIMEFPGSSGVPTGWLECNGQPVSRTTYATLFARIGVTYGSGDGSTTFALPDRRGRISVGIGSDSSTGGRITAATASSIILGGTFGAETHQLTINEMAAHTHKIFDAISGNTTPPITAILSGRNPNLVGFGFTELEGGDQPHNNVQPSIFMRYYIRAL